MREELLRSQDQQPRRRPQGKRHTREHDREADPLGHGGRFENREAHQREGEEDEGPNPERIDPFWGLEVVPECDERRNSPNLEQGAQREHDRHPDPEEDARAKGDPGHLRRDPRRQQAGKHEG